VIGENQNSMFSNGTILAFKNKTKTIAFFCLKRCFTFAYRVST